VATGGAPVIPSDIPGIDKPIVVTAHDVLWGKAAAGDKVVIVGGGEVGCETADYIGERGARQITVVEMLRYVVSDMPFMNREFLTERLNGHGVNLLTSAKVKEILDDGVVYTRNGKEESIRGVSSVILAMGAKSVDGISKAIKDRVAEVYVIGDAKEPRDALEAIHEAYDLACTI
jgi:pyruvate/2-oxoglutarate dehydrogenase complex dihydrolipoamide dehydrogenase (E3) component